MSIHYPEVLFQRAKSYLTSAKRNLEEGLYDVAALEAEVAAQLALKALISKAGLEPPRLHSVRRLLAYVAEVLGGSIDDSVRGFTRLKRKELIILERAREAGQYGLVPVDREEAQIAVGIAVEVVKLVEKLWKMD